MRDEAGAHRRKLALWAVGAGLLVFAPAARGQSFDARATVQYQNVEQFLTLTDPVTGETRRTKIERGFWSQIYELGQYARPLQNLNAYWQVRWNGVSYIASDDATRTPSLLLRLNHPLWGLSQTLRHDANDFSVTNFSSLSPLPSSLRLTSNTSEAASNFYLTVPKWPRLDLSWVERRREADLLSPRQTGRNRNARLNYDVGPLNLRGGYGDMKRSTAGSPLEIFQRNYEAGTTYQLNPIYRLGLVAQYDYTSTQLLSGSQQTERTQQHAGSLNGSYRVSPRADWGLFYLVRQSDVVSRGELNQTDHEGSLMFNSQLSQAARFTAGGGIRTVRQPTGRDLERYLLATFGLSGYIRPRWQGIASINHQTVWSPHRDAYSVEGLRFAAFAGLLPRLDARADVLIGINSDSLSRETRSNISTQTSAGVTANPLRSMFLSYSFQSYLVGSSVFGTQSRAVTNGVDVRWLLIPGAEVQAGWVQSGALPRNDPRVTSLRTALRLTPTPRLQLQGTYTKSDQFRRDVVVTETAGRETVGARLIASLNHSLTLNAGFDNIDPGRAREARSYDAMLTWTFRR